MEVNTRGPLGEHQIVQGFSSGTVTVFRAQAKPMLEATVVLFVLFVRAWRPPEQDGEGFCFDAEVALL